MTLTEKVAYLKGLMEGLNIDTDKPEGKVLKSIADILEDMAVSVSDLEDSMEDVKEYVDELDDDLTDVEDIVYDDEDDEDDEDDDEYEDDEEDDEDDDGDGDFVEVECPYCGETVYFDPADVDPENIICPSCNQGFSCICDECDGVCENCDACESCEDLKKLDGEDDE